MDLADVLHVNRDRVMRLVAEAMSRKHLAPVGERADLRNAGLSSLDIVNLMLAVENEFDLEVPDEAMTPDNFASVAAIEALIERLR